MTPIHRIWRLQFRTQLEVDMPLSWECFDYGPLRRCYYVVGESLP